MYIMELNITTIREKLLKQLIKLVVMVMILLTGGTGESVKAQALNNNSNGGQQLFCSRDFGTFITNGLDFDGEGFIDYWRDMLVIYNTNYCQYTDIDSLHNRIDKARKQIREAFYACDNDTADRVTGEYYQMSAELYYLRHFVSTKESPNPKASDKEKDQNVQLNASIHDMFINMFVKKLKYFNTDQAEIIFIQLKQKYESKLANYKNCSDPNIGMLKEKTVSLINTIETIKMLGKRFVESTQARWNAMEKRIAANPGFLAAPYHTSLGDVFTRFVGVRVNGEAPLESTIWEQISNTAKENAPFTYGKTKPLPAAINFSVISNDLSTISARDQQNDMDIQYVSQYDLKYRQVGGSGLDKLKTNLITLQQTIEDTFKPMDQVRVCAAYIIGKQCGGT